MPIFEYQCNDCRKKFEELTFGRDVKVSCPECGGENTGKLLSTFATSSSSSSSPPSSLPCGQQSCDSGFS